MPFQKKRQPYVIVMSIILAIVTVFYSARIFSLQIVNAENYSDSAAGIVYRKATLKAARGDILDSSGRKIAVNRDGYDIVFESAYLNRDNINSLLTNLISLCEQYGCEYVDNLPINKENLSAFTDDEREISKLKKFLGVADYATAQNCYDRLCEKYSLSVYDDVTARKIMGVRYSMDSYGFSVSLPYTFAEDISQELMLVISEAGYILSGVNVQLTPYREYAVTDLAPHLIGTTGPIYSDEWETYKAKGYSMNDKVGKSGIEQYAEEYLHGIDGEITYKIDSSGKVISSEITKAPVQGKTIMLTLDKKLQTSAQNALASVVEDLKSKGGSVTGGAAVVVDVKNGGVLASANYPSYDLATLSEKYEELIKEGSGNPLLDRAFTGVYPIGSTIKPIVAIAAMENGKYTVDEQIVCKRTYEFFSDYQPSCMHRHGSIGLNTALARSCNYFFFELGRRVGIKSLNQYFKDFGLGVKTGVEINDKAGLLNEYESDSGNTIQVAIGQLNAFTPLQLANYAATLANGGTHYKATLIDGITSHNGSEVYYTNSAQVLNTVTVSDSTLSAVKSGMLSVTEDGTGSTVFGNYPIKVGGKTGTSQVEGQADHSVFVAFAPFDDPQIAVAVILEHGSSTYGVTSVARAIFDGYFFSSNDVSGDVLPYTVLG